MGGFMNALLSLARVLCGTSVAHEEAPTEYQRPDVPTQRPQFSSRHPIARHDTLSKPLPARPQIPPQHHPVGYGTLASTSRPPPERPPHHRPERKSKKHTERPTPYHRPEQKSKPVSHHKPEVPTKGTPSRHHPKQGSKSTSHPKPEVLTKQSQIPCPEQKSKPSSYPPLAHQSLQAQNQINNHDDYTALRAKAVEHGDLMARSFQESHEAYSKGRRAIAKQLSEKGKQHERMMESLNAEASAWIFRQNNMDSEPGEIDLHGLYVKEAVSYVEKAIEEARGKGIAELRLIVGKGLHSDGGIAKIKPAIEELMERNNIPIEVDPRNGGVLVVRLR